MMMDGTRISVPLRTANVSGKKMRKRRELDALVASNGLKRYSGYNGGPVCVKPGTNYHDQLLSESTDEQEDYWRARNKMVSKRNRSSVSKRRCSSLLNVCTLILACGCIMATTAVLWLFLDLRHQADYLHNEMNQVITGNQGIPESLQKCHLQTKELQRNQTDLYSRFVGLNATVINLTYEVSSISSELKLIQDKLKSFSELTDVPVTLKEHFQSISTLQNWIDEFNDTVTQLKASENHFEEEFEEFQLNLTSFKERLTSLEKVPKVNASAVNDEKSNSDLQKLTLLVNKLNENVTYLNNSLTNEIELLQNKPFQDPAVFENLLNQNISTRLSTLETEFYNVSNNVKNLTRQIDENIKLKFANNETK